MSVCFIIDHQLRNFFVLLTPLRHTQVRYLFILIEVVSYLVWLMPKYYIRCAFMLWALPVLRADGIARLDAQLGGASPVTSASPAVVDKKEALAIMAPKSHGTCPHPVQERLRYDIIHLTILVITFSLTP
jgi:hypothetical protein